MIQLLTASKPHCGFFVTGTIFISKKFILAERTQFFGRNAGLLAKR